MLNKLKLGQKMALAIALTFILFILAMGVALSSLQNVGGRFQQFLEQDQVLASALDEMYAQGLQMGQATRNVILDPENPRAYQNRDAARDAFASALDLFAQTAGSNAELLALANQLRELRHQQENIQAQVLKLAQEDMTRATEFLNSQETPLWRNIRGLLLEHRGPQQQQTERSNHEVMNFISERSALSLSLGLAAFVIGLLLMFLLTRSITRPIAETVTIAHQLAEGNLNVRIDAESQDETGQLKRAMQTLVDKLILVIGEVRGATDNLASASEQVSSTAQTLSQAASEQAAGVEETSASIEQMTASISQNAENAKLTDSIATKAAQEATEGGNAVNETVAAMKQIADQISIIDDIAYQTNLLALNAAIEAARAGDHGKGFAVVAAEVRKLAERSQVAAHEISQVARNSVELAERAGQLLDEMVPGIKKTSDLVQEISAASVEQSSGVGEINAAIGQLSQITQQNAAASEELAATAEEMSNQAEQLQRSVSFFQLTRATTHPAKVASPKTMSPVPRSESPVDGNSGDFIQF